MQLTYGQRISPFPVYMQGVGHFKSPKMADIYDPDVGDSVYYTYLCLLSDNSNVVLKLIGKESFLSASVLRSVKTFDLWCALPDEYIQMLLLALKFFIIEDVVFDKERHIISVLSNEQEVGTISRDNFSEVCDLIKQLNVLSRKEIDSHETIRFRNEAARKLHEQLYGNNLEQESEQRHDLELSNLISAIATRSRNYNYDNIWNLTVCQLYDVFFRENNNIAIDAAIRRWCIWGTDKCDIMDEWYKPIDLKEEK